MANYKPHLLFTVMCRNADGYCQHYFDGNCWFAHSQSDLRCRLYAEIGICPNDSCTRAHVLLNVSPPDVYAIRDYGRAPRCGQVVYVRNLSGYPLPHQMAELVPQKKEDIREKRLEAVRFFRRYLNPIRAPLTPSNCKDRLTALLQIEEVFELMDLKEYSLRGALLSKEYSSTYATDMYRVDVPGLAENRPSVLRGDRILIYHHRLRQWYGGTVHFVNIDHLVFALPLNFVYEEGMCGMFVDVDFVMSRTQTRVMMEAVEEGDFLSDEAALSTTDLGPSMFPCPEAFRVDESDINEEQRAVVKQFCDRIGPKVVALWGPPGTGKTTTVVYAIMEFVRVYGKGTKVLVCTPSNEAADLIVERLDHHSPINVTMLRVQPLTRDAKNVPDVVKKYSKGSGNSFEFPSLVDLLNANIVVTTMTTAAKFYGMGISADHFKALVVDEAGHATETLFMAAHLSARKAQRILLAGDHKQLGPHIRAPPNVEAQLGMSVLERLLEHSTAVCLSLTINYRGHPSLVHVVNTVYNDALRPCDRMVRTPNAFVGKRIQQDEYVYTVPKEHPVLFVHHEGRESRENDSPSWMNQSECHIVVYIAWDLRYKHKVAWKDIAIISPYRKQVKKIEQILFKFIKEREPDCLIQGKVLPCRVMTVEMFQGRESRVVIVSCVRNSAQEIATDRHFGIGFLKQPQRANVAMSRAKELMVVVGNACILSADDLWKTYLQRIEEMGGVIDLYGNVITWDWIARRAVELKIPILRQTASVVEADVDTVGRGVEERRGFERLE